MDAFTQPSEFKGGKRNCDLVKKRGKHSVGADVENDNHCLALRISGFP